MDKIFAMNAIQLFFSITKIILLYLIFAELKSRSRKRG